MRVYLTKDLNTYQLWKRRPRVIYPAPPAKGLPDPPYWINWQGSNPWEFLLAAWCAKTFEKVTGFTLKPWTCQKVRIRLNTL